MDVANEFAALNENRKSNFGTFKGIGLKIFRVILIRCVCWI